MASRRVDIQISTTADTAGARQAEAAIGSVEQQQADLAAAQKKASERRVEQQAGELRAEGEAQQAARDSTAMRLAAGAALAASARQVAALTIDVIRQYKELGVELRGFESIGLEFADFLTSPFDYVVDAFTDYKADLVALKESQRRVIEQERIYQDTLKAKREEIRAENEAYVKGALSRELQIIEEITAAYGRQKNEIDALRSAQEANIRATEDLALSRGSATPEQVAANRAGREQASRQFDVSRTVRDAESFYIAASEEADAAIAAYQRGVALNLNTMALASEADAATAARDQALLDLESVKNVAESSRAEIAATAVSEQNAVVTSAQSAMTEAAETAKAALETEAAEQGRELTAGAKESLKILTDALRDGIVDPQEMGQVRDAINQVKNSREAADAEIKKSFQELEKANNAVAASQKLMTERLHQQALRFEAIESRLRSGN